ncbi:unnamed protein product [Urochloa decumbens]|uniref:F-box domain-containing protein n=1 Tax=Urochloa decumbens TaxID=240449 RepID=A0ABC8XV02_9POAL
MAAAAHGPSLPPLDDVVVGEILARLPPRDIGAFRAVCRAWNAIASRPSADRFLATTRRPAAAVTVVTRDARRLEFDGDGDRRRPVDIVRFDFFRGRWHPDVHSHKRQPCPRAVSLDGMAISAEAFRSWDGVLCTRVSPWNPPPTQPGADEYMLWNPLTNACAVVSAPAAAGQGRIIGGYAHPVTGRFHILHSSDIAVPGSRHIVTLVTVQLLAVGDGGAGWREVPLPESKTTTISMRGEGDHAASLHGNLHWLVQQPGSAGEAAAAALLVFDTAREEFRLMAAPELRPELDPSTARLRVAPGGKGKLCVLALTQQPPLALEVWVLDDYSDDTRRSWRLRETVRLEGVARALSPRRFAAAAAVEVVEGAHEGEEIFIQLGHWSMAYSVRSKAWRQVSVGRSCAALLLYRESVLQPEISFGKALRVFRRGSMLSRRSRDGRFRRRSYSSFGSPLEGSVISES